MSDTQRIEERAQGRRLARTIIALSELESQPQNVIDGFWDEVSEINPNKPTPIATTGVYPMTDDEAADFENTRIDFGKHITEMFRDIPIEYIAWLAFPLSTDQHTLREAFQTWSQLSSTSASNTA